MAKREVLGGETGARSEEKPNKAYKQLDHPVRLGGILAPTTNRKSLYNRQYGVFTRDKGGTQARERGLQLRAKIDRRATRIANTNVQYAAQIASHLSENVQQFIDEVMRVEYPSVFLPSPVDLAVERLRRINSLTADQKVAVEDVYASYSSQRIPLRRRITRGLLRWEDPGSAELKRRVALYSQYLNEGRDPWLAGQDHPAMKWFEKRRSLAKTTCARLRGIFSDNEFDSLPMSIQIILSW